MRPQALFPTVDRCFYRRCGGSLVGILRIQLLRFDDTTFDDSLQILGNEWANGEINRARIIPQSIELFLHPHHRFGRRVFPKKFIVDSPGRSTFIDATKESCRRTISVPDYASFAMNQAKCRIG
ncbi:hypothetical protein KYC_25738 [Achromobacter arsenitoxydans SY8]|uniref:Uncharacterized protein n=1 Tax=Achromobacter arsenitoxydans SY8 TaxID=477184 RepID=H0FED6_9BURK|nr:hypothetical protein KYC_25738 [Achromobacter arsenitoxydans SY8]